MGSVLVIWQGDENLMGMSQTSLDVYPDFPVLNGDE